MSLLSSSLVLLLLLRALSCKCWCCFFVVIWHRAWRSPDGQAHGSGPARQTKSNKNMFIFVFVAQKHWFLQQVEGFFEHKAYVLASLGAKPRLFAVFGFFQASLSTNAQHIDFTMLCLRSFRFSSPLPQLAWCHFLHVEQPWPVLSRLSLQKSFFSLVGVFFLTSRDVLMTIENTSLVVRPSIRPVPLVHSDWENPPVIGSMWGKACIQESLDVDIFYLFLCRTFNPSSRKRSWIPLVVADRQMTLVGALLSPNTESTTVDPRWIITVSPWWFDSIKVHLRFSYICSNRCFFEIPEILICIGSRRFSQWSPPFLRSDGL